jgi:hypothetical protein
MIQIFPDPPREGEPISKRGIAAGLRRMARAWETLTVEGGTVQWLAGRPKIVFSGDTEGSDGDGDLPPPTTEYMNLTVRNVAESEAPPELKWVEDWVRWPEPEI